MACNGKALQFGRNGFAVVDLLYGPVSAKISAVGVSVWAVGV
jgi:hypothetical protein